MLPGPEATPLPPPSPTTQLLLPTAKKARRLKANDLFLEFQERCQAGPRKPERRATCADDPLLFCRAYLPHHFNVPFSDFHKQDARKLRGAVEDKEWFAIADRREGGKTTRCRGFMLWGACYGRFQYCVYIAATEKLKGQSQNWLMKVLMDGASPLAGDFPELVLPFASAAGKSVSARHKTWKGEPCHLTCGADQIVTANTDLDWSLCNQRVFEFASMEGGDPWTQLRRARWWHDSAGSGDRGSPQRFLSGRCPSVGGNYPSAIIWRRFGAFTHTTNRGIEAELGMIVARNGSPA
ncbi:MAG: hypothetical protein RIK87_20050 [Fuerstiella sp.]